MLLLPDVLDKYVFIIEHMFMMVAAFYHNFANLEMFHWCDWFK